jgi:dnd system-associated protein 4
MADIRIKVAKDKAKLVKALRAGEGSTGPFQTYYEILIFAASLGIKKNRFLPFRDSESSKEIDPIRQEQFSSKGYDQVINLISVMHTGEPGILGDNDESEASRVSIFEGYANGGLEIIDGLVKGTNDFSCQILLLMQSTHGQDSTPVDDLLDLSFL